MPNTDLNPANGTQGSSYLYSYGTSPQTRTAVSQKIRLLTPAYNETATLTQMGVVSQFTPSESRSVESVRGIGFGDIIAEQVPSITEAITGNLERALLYLSNLMQAVGYASGVSGPVRSLRHHRWPFDIEEQIVFSTLVDADLGVPNQGFQGAGWQGGVKPITYPFVTPDGTGVPDDQNRGHSAIITMYEACWLTSYNKTYAKDSGMIMDSGDVSVTDTHDFSSVYGEFLATGNDPTIGQLGSIRFNLNQGDIGPNLAIGG